LPTWLNLTLIASVWLAVLSTLYSGWLYVLIALKNIDLASR
jgi:hypothetical protein